MTKCLAAFMDFCYLVRHNAITTPDLIKIQDTLNRFHQYPKIFITCGVCVDISLPWQHSLKHYPQFIRFFGSPNGLCSSITESKHIKAVKEPWRRSSRFNVLLQMLRTLVRLDKLAALKAVLTLRGMMTGTTSSYTRQVLAGEQPQVIAAESTAPLDDENNDDGVVHGPKSLSDIQLAPTPHMSFCLHFCNHSHHVSITERGYPKTIQGLACHIQQPQLPDLLRRFLHKLGGPLDDGAAPVPIAACPIFGGQITVHHSAVARFYAPSDLNGAGGMYRERIRSNPNWHGYPRHDTVLVDMGAPLMHGIVIGWVLLFFLICVCRSCFQMRARQLVCPRWECT
jgi:hypothetical protein